MSDQLIKTTITYVRGPEQTAREFRRVLKNELAEIGKLWHDEYLPLHFKDSARRKYGYKERSKGYTMRKLRRFGHTRPLVWTGRSEREAKRMARITGTSKRVRVTMSVQRYMYQYRGTGPNKAEEMVAITAAEAEDLALHLDHRMETALANLKGKEVVRI